MLHKTQRKRPLCLKIMTLVVPLASWHQDHIRPQVVIVTFSRLAKVAASTHLMQGESGFRCYVTHCTYAPHTFLTLSCVMVICTFLECVDCLLFVMRIPKSSNKNWVLASGHVLQTCLASYDMVFSRAQ